MSSLYLLTVVTSNRSLQPIMHSYILSLIYLENIHNTLVFNQFKPVLTAEDIV